MKDQDWLAANSGAGIEVAERYIAEAKSAEEPVEAIGRYLLAIDVMRIHLGRMDTESEYMRAALEKRASNPCLRP
jgi:hypothetical protein